MATLLEATHLLVSRRIHRLPVIDSNTGNALNILTHKRMLLYIWTNVRRCSLSLFFETVKLLMLVLPPLALSWTGPI
jgi:hypothetical protein